MVLDNLAPENNNYGTLRGTLLYLAPELRGFTVVYLASDAN